MTALLVAALFMGNCLSCPQILLSIAGNQPAHSCCPHGKTQKVSCESQGLQHFLKAGDGGKATPVVVAIAPAGPLVFSFTGSQTASPLPSEDDPPDLLSLHFSLRI